MSSLLFLDTETTGLSPEKHALIEIGLIAVIDGEVKEEKCFKARPHEGAIIDPDALRINGYTHEEIIQWPLLEDTINEIIKWVDSLERKFSLCGHNVSFDHKFLHKAFCRTGNYGGYCTRFRSSQKCTLQMAKEIGKRKIKTENFKLGTLCKYFDIELNNAHTALPDAKATYELYLKLEAMMPKIILQEFNGTYQEKRRKFLDSKYIIRNHDGSVFLTEEWSKNKQIREFILTELWELEND